MEKQEYLSKDRYDKIDLGELPHSEQDILAIRHNILGRGKTDEFIRKTLNQAHMVSKYRSDLSITQSGDGRYFHIKNQYLSDFLNKNRDRVDIISQTEGNFLNTFEPYTRYTTPELFIQSVKEVYLLSIGIQNPDSHEISWMIRPIELDELVAVSIENIIAKIGMSAKSWHISDDQKWLWIDNLNFHDSRLITAKFPSRLHIPDDIQKRVFGSLYEINNEATDSIFSGGRAVLYPTCRESPTTLLRLIEPDPVIDYIFYPPFETEYQRGQIHNQIVRQIETIK